MRPALVCLLLWAPFLATVVFIPFYWYLLTGENEDVDENSVWILFNAAVYLASKVEEAEKDLQLLKNLCLDLNLMGKKVDLFPFEGGGIGSRKKIRKAETAVDLSLDWKTASTTNVTRALLWSRSAILPTAKLILWLPGSYAYRNNTEATNDIRRCIQFAEGKKKLLLVDNHKMVENITSNVEIVGEIKEILNKVGNPPDGRRTTTKARETSGSTTKILEGNATPGSSRSSGSTVSIGTRPTTSSTTVVFSSTVTTATSSSLAVATTGKAAETTTATTIKLMSTPSKEPSTITRIATSQAWTEEQGPDLGTTSSRGRSTTGKTASTTSTGEISSPGTKAAEPSTWQTTQSLTTMETTEPVTTKTRGWTEVTTRRSTKGNGPTMGGQTEGPTTGAEEVETLMTDWTEVITTAPVERTTGDAATTAKVATGPTHTEVITTGPSRLPETTVVTYDTTTVPDKETVEPRTEVEVDRTRTTAGEESITEKGWTEAIPEGGTDASTTPQNTEYTTLSWTQMEEDRTTKATEKGDLTTGEQWTEVKTASTPSVHVTGEVTTAQQETTRDHFTEVTTEGDTAATTVEQWTDVPSTASQLPTSVEEETSPWTEAISGEVMTTVRQDLATTPPTEVTLKPWTEAESPKTSTSEDLTTEEGWAEATTEGDAEAVTFGTSKNVEHTTGSWTEVDRDGTTMVTEGVDPTTGKQWTEMATASTPDVLTTTEEKMTQPPFTAVPIEENTTPTTVELWTEVTSTELQNLTDEVTSAFTEAPSMVTREDVPTPITGQTLKPWTEVDTTLAPTEEEPTTGETWTDATAGGGTEAVTFGTFQKDEYTTGAWTEIGRDSTTMIPEGVDLTTAALYGDMTTIPDETTRIPFTEVTIEETPTTVEQRIEIPIEISTEPFSESFTTGKGWTEDEVETTKSGVEEEMTTRKWTEVKGETTVEQWTEKTGATTTGVGEEGTEGGRTEETAETIWTTAAEASEELTTGEQGTTGRGWTEVDAGEPTTVSEPEWTAAAGEVTSASSWTEMRTEVPTAVPEATTAVDWTEGENEQATTAENRAEGGVTTADQSWTEAPYSVNVTEDGTPPPNDPVVALLLA